MQCEDCGKGLHKSTRDLHLHDSAVGSIYVNAAELWQCASCGSVLYPAATAARISCARQQRILDLVGQRPVSEFVTPGEAARLLGQTKQAFSKSLRVRNGFIYSTSLGKRSFYLKASVLAFRDSGDGRFSLVTYTVDATEYNAAIVAEQQQATGVPNRYTGNDENLERVSFVSITEEPAYA